MHVKSIHCDCWTDRQDSGTTLPNPSMADIERAVRELDGATKTIVTLEKGPNAYMAIAARWNDRVIVNETPDNREFHSLVDRNAPDEEVILYVGGQDSNFSKRLFVPIEWALAATKAYLETGERDESLSWQSDY